MAKVVYVRLKDAGSMFLSLEHNEEVNGVAAVGIKFTDRVRAAIKAGALIELKDEAEAAEWNKMKKVTTPAALTPEAVAKSKEDAEKFNAELLDKINAATTDKDVLELSAQTEDVEIKKAANTKLRELRNANSKKTSGKK